MGQYSFLTFLCCQPDVTLIIPHYPYITKLITSLHTTRPHTPTPMPTSAQTSSLSHQVSLQAIPPRRRGLPQAAATLCQANNNNNTTTNNNTTNNNTLHSPPLVRRNSINTSIRDHTTRIQHPPLPPSPSSSHHKPNQPRQTILSQDPKSGRLPYTIPALRSPQLPYFAPHLPPVQAYIHIRTRNVHTQA